MIKLKNVTFHYKNTDARGRQQKTRGVDGVSLHIKEGEFVILAGDSGCGKTTITRLINGLVPHYYEGEISGEITVRGISVLSSGIGDLAPYVGSVFQNPRSQFFNVDTTSELAFASENMCVDPQVIHENIKRVASEMNIENLMDRSIFSLSGGEKQKIACASVAVAGPEIMVMDEPSSNLDAEGIEELRRILAQWKQQGRTIVIAEHRFYFLTQLADRLLLMEEGKIAEELGHEQLVQMTQEEAYARGLRALSEVGPGEWKKSGGQSVGGQESSYLVCKDFDFHYKHSDNGIHFSELRFEKGKITAIVGRNGTGKSTFARVLCGLERRATGNVFFDGKSWPRKKRMGLCFLIMQDVNHQLFTESVMEEVRLSVPGSVPEEDKEARAREALKKLDLAELADTHPMALSGGQKQRVAIACAVVSGAPLLLFDEPTSGLDLRHMQQVSDVLRLLREEGRTVLVITHDWELVREAADGVVEMGSSEAV